jgi:hypothetical protein
MDLEINSFIRICHYLPTGMILRCCAVCKHWSELGKSDDLWIMILGIELRREVGLSLQSNIRLNRQIAVIWKKEFSEKHKGTSAKHVYMNLRRSKIKWTEKSQPGYIDKIRIFPHILCFPKEQDASTGSIFTKKDVFAFLGI